METPPSLFRLSPGSTCSSSLVMTPAPEPVTPLRGPLPKGPLQPHISNLPRRRKAPPIVTTSNVNIDISPSSGTSSRSTYAQTPIQLPTLPFPISAGGIPQRRIPESEQIEQISVSLPSLAPRGTVQPSHANVPRRARALTVPAMRARQRHERSIQELGHASGVFIALAGDAAEEQTDDEKEFDAVVRVVPGGSDADDVDAHAHVTVLSVAARGARDDGVPCLREAQLRAVCAFVAGHRAEGRRVVITAPPAHAVDALGSGVCCVFPTAESTPCSLDDGEVDPEPLHRLLMRWHDLPSPDGDDDDCGGGLKDAWRGLLSREGMDYLAAVLAIDTTSTTTPPSP